MAGKWTLPEDIRLAPLARQGPIAPVSVPRRAKVMEDGLAPFGYANTEVLGLYYQPGKLS